ncbi:hypothetical protein JJD41_20570 [Oxynema sp. CENA135]|uniref:hypothetical protein n=1 Tax=Oxynema sp. CENA135 TaxID=984206 RepID=UPI00190C3929|nr:hypothetical protein [Oxynema sp. CENA135]MBK4732243.1 hypothetical protein [Oxynema sp. CENA135]
MAVPVAVAAVNVVAVLVAVAAVNPVAVVLRLVNLVVETPLGVAKEAITQANNYQAFQRKLTHNPQVSQKLYTLWVFLLFFVKFSIHLYRIERTKLKL